MVPESTVREEEEKSPFDWSRLNDPEYLKSMGIDCVIKQTDSDRYKQYLDGVWID